MRDRQGAELKPGADLGDPECVDIGRLGAALTAQENRSVVIEVTREIGEEGLGKYRLPRLPGLGLLGGEHQPVALALKDQLAAQTDGGEVLDSHRTVGQQRDHQPIPVLHGPRTGRPMRCGLRFAHQPPAKLDQFRGGAQALPLVADRRGAGPQGCEKLRPASASRTAVPGCAGWRTAPGSGPRAYRARRSRPAP